MRGPKGQWRPAGAGALAAHICKIATGEIEETYEPPVAPEKDPAASQQARARGRARAKKLTPERRREIAKTAAAARWNRNLS